MFKGHDYFLRQETSEFDWMHFCLDQGPLFVDFMSCHTHPNYQQYMKAVKSAESKYPTLLQSLGGWGVQIYKWGLQIKLNPKLLLQPY